jgi:hypothetical protein
MYENKQHVFSDCKERNLINENWNAHVRSFYIRLNSNYNTVVKNRVTFVQRRNEQISSDISVKDKRSDVSHGGEKPNYDVLGCGEGSGQVSKKPCRFRNIFRDPNTILAHEAKN